MDFFHMILIWLHLYCTYDSNMKELSYVNHMYIVSYYTHTMYECSYDSHMMICQIWFDIHMIHLRFSYNSHRKANAYENHMWRNSLCSIKKPNKQHNIALKILKQKYLYKKNCSANNNIFLFTKKKVISIFFHTVIPD